MRVFAVLFCLAAPVPLCAQQPAATPDALPQAPDSASISGVVTDTDNAAVPGATVTLQNVATRSERKSASDANGVYTFPSVAPGTYLVMISAKGFASWKIKDVIVVHLGETFTVPNVELGVESITTSVNAITVEDLAEQQITAEEHQRILGILPNFYVSYLSNAAPLTRKQKFKLAFVVSRDPVTFATTGITAGIEQSQGNLQGYGQGFAGYARRYGATYGDRITATFLGAAAFPSLFRQDPRYFYRGHGRVIVRALYAISTVAICKGDNGHFQPNYSNVLGNVGSGLISSLYYPNSDQHDVQTTVENTLIGISTGAIGTLFQEFLLRHVTRGAPPKTHP
jgi:Carboxypeptidase regulatory-like domain